MLVTMMKSKIHRAAITDIDLNYEASISIDGDLMRQATIFPHEKVQVVNLNNGSRFTTYAIEGRPGSGEIRLNGPAARLGLKGDKIIIISYCILSRDEIGDHRPAVIKVDDDNKIL
jgi:aspartate 1-decarboxylase